MQSWNPALFRLLLNQLLSPASKRKSLKSLCTPDLIISNISELPVQALRNRGFKCLVFDKDNTLTAPYVNSLHPPFTGVWNQCLEVFGRDGIVVVSNSAGGPDDKGGGLARKVQEELGVRVLQSRRKKPEGAEEILQHFNRGLGKREEGDMVVGSQIVVVGDRVFTDVVYAHTIGAHAVLCRDIITEKGDNWFAAKVRSF